ncbi:hypothetical protein, partial [Mycobacterium sp.]|uniref:hypothetical protein n=1 Tax=Mycobacterium sp. TaxID=1785 RepID=UPI0031E03733
MRPDPEVTESVSVLTQALLVPANATDVVFNAGNIGGLESVVDQGLAALAGLVASALSASALSASALSASALSASALSA